MSELSIEAMRKRRTVVKKFISELQTALIRYAAIGNPEPQKTNARVQLEGLLRERATLDVKLGKK